MLSLSLFFSLALVCASAEALTLTETQKLLETDGGDRNYFGYSLSLSGNTALIGTPYDNDRVYENGSAYIFVLGSDGRWHEQAKLLPRDDGGMWEVFGDSVSIDGDTALIGAPGDNDNGIDSGLAYIFVRGSDGQWQEQTELLASDGTEDAHFGTSVAVNGNAALVGASGQEAAYIFVRGSDGQWQEQAKLQPSDHVEGDKRLFGSEVALSGDTALVSAHRDDENGTASGAAYVFVRGGDGLWIEQAKLLPSDGEEEKYFGWEVALSDDTALIGAPYDSEKNYYNGAAYIFVRGSDGRWTEQAKLMPGREEYAVGGGVAINGNTALIGSIGIGGVVYLFVRGSDGQWREQAILRPSILPAPGFGDEVAVSGDTAFVGAPEEDGENGNSAGAAYVFNLAAVRAKSAELRYAITPCRILDTRDPDAVANGLGTLAGGGETRPALAINVQPDDIQSQGGLPGGCGIPQGATSVDVNVTAVDPLGFGYLRLYPYVQGGTQLEPQATVLAWHAGRSIANALRLTLCVNDGGVCDFEFVLKNYGTGTDLVMEVLGYYLPADAAASPVAEVEEGESAGTLPQSRQLVPR